MEKFNIKDFLKNDFSEEHDFCKDKVCNGCNEILKRTKKFYNLARYIEGVNLNANICEKCFNSLKCMPFEIVENETTVWDLKQSYENWGFDKFVIVNKNCTQQYSKRSYDIIEDFFENKIIKYTTFERIIVCIIED